MGQADAFPVARHQSRWRALVARLRDALRQRPADDDRIERTVYGFILRHSLRDQILLVVLTLASFPFLYLSLELPKTIVNHAIGGQDARAVGGEAVTHRVLGLELSQIEYLAALSLAFLALVVANGAFKYVINVMKGRLGERMLRRLRFQLYERTLRFPLPHFSRVSAGEIIAMVTAELEPVAGFIGDSFALPISQTGTLLTIFAFMFVQDPLLGAAAVSLYPVQGWLIPKLQRKVRQLGRRRVRRIRRLAERIGESIAARVDIRANAHEAYQLAEMSGRLGEIYDIRYEIYRRKFFIKFLNNFLNQLTPFFFYLIGGYLVIAGRLSLGALVAILAAYKDLSGPWKELLDFYQDQQDVAIKYEQVVEQFEVADMLPPFRVEAFAAPADSLRGEVSAVGLTYRDADGLTRLDGADFAVAEGTHVALVGQSTSGKFELAALAARLIVPTAGRIEIDGRDLPSMPPTVTGRRLGYCSSVPALVSGSLRDALLMGLRHRPPADPPPERMSEARRRAVLEARRSGNLELDPRADWIDYAQAGVADADALDRRILEVLRCVGFEEEVYALGLRSRLDEMRHPEAAATLVEARRLLRERLAEAGEARLVEPWDPARYNANASVAENLLFGRPVGAPLGPESVAADPYVQRILEEEHLDRDLLQVGRGVAEAMVEMFGELARDRALIDEFSLIGADEVPRYRAIIGRVRSDAAGAISREDRAALLALAFSIVAARHRLGLLDEATCDKIVRARARFAGNLPRELRGTIAFFDPARFNPAASIEENILFGKVAAGETQRPEWLEKVIAGLLDELGLRSLVVEIGLAYPVGTGGARLSPAQRQKASLARALLKRPDILVLNEATTALDGAAQLRALEGVRRDLAGRSLFWSVQQAQMARPFDQVLVLMNGRLVAQGAYRELERSPGALAQLISAERAA
jgi:ABC-type multidrug transport system fused ATPase/permease subunit